MKTKLLMLSLFLSIAFVSCSREEKPENQEAITVEEGAINAKIDIASDDIADIVAEQEASTYNDNINGRSTDAATSVYTTCATITRVPDFGTTITPGTTVTKTINFGTGCTLPNGNIVKGKIIISFVYDPNATTHTINYQFADFYHNQIKYNGNKSFTRTIVNNLPVITMNMELTATFPNGNVYTRTGQRIREVVSGYGDADWTNNIYKVTGQWSTTYPNTSVQQSTITSPLIIKMSCAAVNKPLIVQGVITFTRNNNVATLNYGAGDCDKTAVFTYNGLAFTIIIGN